MRALLVLAFAALGSLGACKQRTAGAENSIHKPAASKDEATAPKNGTEHQTEGAKAAEPETETSPPAQDAVAERAPSTETFDAKLYGWLGNERAKYPPPTSSLLSRFETPPGYERIPVQPGSFAAWLRTLPLAAPLTPVTSFKGDVVRPADGDYVAAVVAIDTGSIDLQQSPDVVLRLHAEWMWSSGRAEKLSYRGATRLDMPFSRWLKGERLLAGGEGSVWVPRAKPSKPDHDELRAFLDGVFTWANSTSVASQAARVSEDDASPGDFFIHVRSPGHAVIILDMARKKTGERLALLGQALNPAQSIHVLGPGRKTAWFSLRPPLPVITPYTDEFPWDGLRRFPDEAPTGNP